MATTTAKAGPGDEIRQKDLAVLFGVDTAMVRKLEMQGVFTRCGRGLYELGPAVRGYVDWLKDENRRGQKHQSTTRYQDAKAAKVQLELQAMAGELIAVGEAQAAMDTLVASVAGELSGLPAAITRDRALKAKIDEALTERMNRIARALEKAGRRLDDSDDGSGDGDDGED